MIRELIIENTVIRYNLEYKRVKNINLRIKPDCSVNVSANKRVPVMTIDEFMLSKSDFIFRALNKYSNVSDVERKQYFAESEIKDYILKICKEVYPYFERFGIKYPEIKFRKMISRWGSCHSHNEKLTFNTYLMYAPPECVKYVILHEFTHFLQPDHSSKFYNELAKVCPNWKECRKKLKDINIR